jgi:hypothetical protein
MRTLFLSLAAGLLSLGLTAVTPTQAPAQSDHGLNPADNVQVQWAPGWERREWRREWNRPGWWGNSYYYYPGYATYYYPYSNYTFYPGYSSYYYTPGYSSYYVTPGYNYWATPGYYVPTYRRFYYGF